jgi:NDMA-dependent alcohol dehydrogenase
MNIQAAVLHAPQTPFLIERLTLAKPQTGEVLVRLAASGVCHSDYHLVSGATRHPLPLVAGHEGAGVVEAVGEGVSQIQPGDHVVLSWSPDCGHCFYCLHGKPNLCETFTEPIWAGTMLDGTTRLYRGDDPVYHYCGLATFAEYAVVPQESCIVIRRDVPLTIAALVGCAVATGVGATFYTSPVNAGESVVVIGCGGIGLSILQGAALRGASTIIAVDTNPAKLEMTPIFGATHALLADAQTNARIRDLTGGRGADHVFEAVGLPSVQENALDAVRPGGTLALVGLSPMGTGTNLPGAIITRQEKTIKGSYYGSVNPRRDFPLLLDLYINGQLALDQLVTQQYRLDQINAAYDAMLTGGVARGVIIFDH